MNEKKIAWVNKVNALMRQAETNSPSTVGAVIVNNNKIIVTITKNIDNPRIGVAVCNPTDTFDLNTGIAIAYAKAKGWELPCFITCDGCDDTEDEWEDEDEDDNWEYEDYAEDEEEDEDDYYADDEDEDEDEEDEDWGEDEEDEVLEFDDIPIGTRFLDTDDDLCMKISETKYYCYLMNEILPCNEDDEIVKKVIQ